MRGRKAVDPDLARVVEQRLERLLAERNPRRAEVSEPEPEVDTAKIAVEPEDTAGTPGPSGPSHPSGRAVWSGFTRVHLAVIGVLVLVGVLLGGWAVLRAQPVPLPAVAVPRVTSTGGMPASPTGGASSAPPPATGSPAGGPAAGRAGPALVVHVLGAVRRPGLVELSAGARVQDAIEAAGGLRPDARLGDLNLAQPLVDGQQLVVGERGDRSQLRGGAGPPASSASSGGSSGTSSAPGGLLDLNTATAEQLDTLPGVGPVTAAKILAWREEHGRFNRVEELQEVAGIGPKTYAEIAPRCRV